MNEKHIQVIGFLITAVYSVFIVFLYAAEPRSIGDISVKARATIEKAATTGQVLTGTYQIDQTLFNEGLKAFYSDNFIAARDYFGRADPERRDTNTQFYIAYSYYRQGWGRLSNDDALFQSGLEALDRVNELDRAFRSSDANLQLKSPAELRNELEQGMRVTADDFNPIRVFRERK